MKLRTLKFHFPPNLVSSGGKSHSFEDCSSVLKETLLKDHAEGSMGGGLGPHLPSPHSHSQSVGLKA